MYTKKLFLDLQPLWTSGMPNSHCQSIRCTWTSYLHVALRVLPLPYLSARHGGLPVSRPLSGHTSLSFPPCFGWGSAGRIFPSLAAAQNGTRPKGAYAVCCSEVSYILNYLQQKNTISWVVAKIIHCLICFYFVWPQMLHKPGISPTDFGHPRVYSVPWSSTTDSRRDVGPASKWVTARDSKVRGRAGLRLGYTAAVFETPLPSECSVQDARQAIAVGTSAEECWDCAVFPPQQGPACCSPRDTHQRGTVGLCHLHALACSHWVTSRCKSNGVWTIHSHGSPATSTYEH